MTGIRLEPVSGYLWGWLPRWALVVGLLLALAGCGNLETAALEPTALATPPSVERLTEAPSPTASATIPTSQVAPAPRPTPTPTSAAVPTSRVAAVPSPPAGAIPAGQSRQASNPTPVEIPTSRVEPASTPTPGGAGLQSNMSEAGFFLDAAPPVLEKRIRNSDVIGRAAARVLQAIMPEGEAPDPNAPVFGLSARQIGRRLQAAAKAAGLGGGFTGHPGGWAWPRTWRPQGRSCRR